MRNSYGATLPARRIPFIVATLRNKSQFRSLFSERRWHPFSWRVSKCHGFDGMSSEISTKHQHRFIFPRRRFETPPTLLRIIQHCPEIEETRLNDTSTRYFSAHFLPVYRKFVSVTILQDIHSSDYTYSDINVSDANTTLTRLTGARRDTSFRPKHGRAINFSVMFLRNVRFSPPNSLPRRVFIKHTAPIGPKHPRQMGNSLRKHMLPATWSFGYTRGHALPPRLTYGRVRRGVDKYTLYPLALAPLRTRQNRFNLPNGIVFLATS